MTSKPLDHNGEVTGHYHYRRSYQYDAFGRRIAKDMDGKTTQFIWQGDKKTNPRSRMHSS